MDNKYNVIVDDELTDVLMICNGWYNKKKYSTILDALNAYYHKYYGCEDIVMDKPLASHMFLQPLALQLIEMKPNLAKYLFGIPIRIHNEGALFDDVKYDNLLRLIANANRDMFDLSAYDDMLKQAEQSDDAATIGII